MRTGMEASSPQQRTMSISLETMLIALNAALYAGIGYLTYLGIFAPLFGTVRFWPVVFIPALFTVLFSPKIGAAGAGIGIFISDMLIHGNALLSLTVGVPANVLGFYILGVAYRAAKRWNPQPTLGGLLIAPLAAVSLVSAYLLSGEPAVATFFLAVAGASVGIGALLMLALAGFSIGGGLAYTAIRHENARLLASSSLGLLVGSAIIGVGVWAYSQFLALPSGLINAPLYAALVLFLWTYLSEIPFLVALLPPLVKAVKRAMPAWMRQD
ncbi:MAG: hypothetical protein NXY59_07235 [Aigarchaeota archaeon]|nr:hypothetical protein [Candidatus Pelearchaeum maunauluense]